MKISDHKTGKLPERMAKGITAIVEVTESSFPQIKGSVAAVRRSDGTMYLNMTMIEALKKEGIIDKEGHVLTFIMLHEAGHVVLDTNDELAVDEWAFWNYTRNNTPLGCFAWSGQNNKSLKKSVYALTRILKFDKAEDFKRAELQLQRALKYDNK